MIRPSCTAVANSSVGREEGSSRMCVWGTAKNTGRLRGRARSVCKVSAAMGHGKDLTPSLFAVDIN